MTVISIAVVLIAVTLIILTCFMVPAFLEIRKTAVSMRELGNYMESELKPFFRDIRIILADLKVTTEVTATKAEEVSIFLEELGNTGRNLRSINRFASVVTGFVAGSSLWMTGAKVAGRLIVDKLIKKRG